MIGQCLMQLCLDIAEAWMTNCQMCALSPHHYNLTCIDCAARHTLTIFMPKSDRLGYMTRISAQYGLDLEQLKQKVIELNNLRKGK